MNTFIMALKNEAYHLIKRYHLTLVVHQPFKVYQTQNMRVILSGVGKSSSYAATKFALEDRETHHGLWVNFGVAGDSALPVGSLVSISKVTEDDTGRSWYPYVKQHPKCYVKALRTYNSPICQYPLNSSCDMEASGFMAAVSEAISSEHIHVLKLISDNSSSGIGNLTKALMKQLVAENIELINTYIKSAEENLSIEPKSFPFSIEKMFQGQHFTVTQTHQLLELYRSFCALCPEEAWPSIELNNRDTPSDILAKLRLQITRLSPKL
tara:strand:+ start:209 stop:1009 length:801 start_codon:yes stop_codon:yes gene_type:complete